MRRLVVLCVASVAALSTLVDAQLLTTTPPNQRWVQTSESEVRLIDWDAVSSVTFEKQTNRARLTGLSAATGAISDAPMIQRLRRAVLAEPDRWVRCRTKQGGSWVEPTVAETFVDILQTRHVAIVQPIDVGGRESFALAVTPNEPLGLVVDDIEKARVRALWAAHWP
jgi:hypothetical protein